MVNFFITKTMSHRQANPTECGAACLAMILDHFGCSATNHELRLLADVSRNGADAASMIKAASHYGLVGSAKRLLSSELIRLKSPMILFFDQCHFVVFEGYWWGRFYINDPALGRYSLDRQSFKRRYNNIAIQFLRSEKFIKKKKQAFVSRMSLTGLDMAQIVPLGLFCGLILILLSHVAGLLLNNRYDSIDSHPWWIISGTLLLFSLLGLSCWILWRSMLRVFAKGFFLETTTLKDGLLKVPLGFFEDFSFNDYSVNFLRSSSRWRNFSSNEVLRVFLISVALVILFAIATLSLAIALCISIVILILALQRMANAVIGDPQRAYGDGPWDLVNQSSDQAFFLNDEMRAMGQWSFMMDHLLKNVIDKLALHQIHRQSLGRILLLPWLPIILSLPILGAVIADEWLVGKISMSDVFSLPVMLFILICSVPKIFAPPKEYREDNSAAVLEELQAITTPHPREVIDPNSGSLVELHGVKFSYPGSKNKVVDGVNLRIRSDRIIGFIGPPLLGKTTILHILSGKIIPTGGEIVHYLEGDASLRISLIDEDSKPFAGSLRDNLCLFSTRISEQEMVDCLEDADAIGLFHNRPLGLLTPIWPDGKNLSYGERKRLLLAQSLLHQADVLLLDNFFDDLGHGSSHKIIENLRRRCLSTILTTYDEALLAICDEVIFFKNADEVIVDRHEILSSNNETYEQLLVRKS